MSIYYKIAIGVCIFCLLYIAAGDFLLSRCDEQDMYEKLVKAIISTTSTGFAVVLAILIAVLLGGCSI